LLEKLTDPRFQSIAKPSEHALKLVGQILETNPEPAICEVGVGIGATTIEFCKLLDNKGMLYLFDFEDRLTDLGEDIKAQGFENVRAFMNTRKTFDSYNWALSKLVLENRAADTKTLFDFAYLDGCHMFHHDAPATLLLKELVKPGGILLMDDYNWSIALSPTMRPSAQPTITKHYTDEQIEVPHVAMICSVFLDDDPRFEKMEIGYATGHEHRRAYRKL
jgi:predicted O-methyltransferase YrrM